MSEPINAERLAEIANRAELVVRNHADWSVAAAVMLAGRDVPALLAEVERLNSENEVLRHIIASTDREPEIYAANGMLVKVKDGRVTVEYEGGAKDE